MNEIFTILQKLPKFATLVLVFVRQEVFCRLIEPNTFYFTIQVYLFTKTKLF